MGFFKRMEGTFFSPKQLAPALAEKPIWVDVLVVCLLAVIIFSVIATPYQRQESAQIFRDSPKLKEKMGEAKFAETLAKMEKPAETADFVRSGAMAAIMTAGAMLIQCLFLLMIGRFVSSQGTFVQVFAVYLNAALIDRLLGNAVRTALVLTKRSVIQVSTGLGLLFPGLPVGSPLYAVTAQIDVFQLWMFGVMAYGLAAVLKIDLKKALAVSYGFWLLKAAANVILSIGAMKLVS